MITFFHRKKSDSTFSIELLFSLLLLEIEKKSNVPIRNIFAPNYSHKILMLLKNIFWAYKNQTSINHISGDIHYIILAFNKNNLNILTIHDCALLHKLNKKGIKYHIYKLLWFDLPVRKADIITTISESTKSDIIKFTGCSPEKIKIIPNFYNPSFVYIPRKFNKEEPNILHIGTAPHKNLTRLILAVKNIKCTLTIIGKIDTEILNLLKNNNIKYTNLVAISNEEVVLQYQQCDIVYFVSLFEGFGVPILEAQASGRALISSDRSPMREVAGAGACLVDPESIDAIRSGLTRLIQDDEYRNMVIENGLTNSKKYSLEEIKHEYIKLYKKKNTNSQ